ncbi:hypothetical protein [Ferrovibrio sp.]|uniref:hypothetical protein n=1 Tax=Ferrovibrio sp. TaxID=1917215 RepID=UPI00311E8E3D
MDFNQGLFSDNAAESGQEDAGYASGYHDDPVIDVDAEDIEDIGEDAPGQTAPLPRMADRFNTETRFHGLSLSQLAVHSLWIVDYLRQLGETEMSDGDIDSIGRCADDLEGAIMLMFQLAGGTRQELRQRYHEIKLALMAHQSMTFDRGRTQ